MEKYSEVRKHFMRGRQNVRFICRVSRYQGCCRAWARAAYVNAMLPHPTVRCACAPHIQAGREIVTLMCLLENTTLRHRRPTYRPGMLNPACEKLLSAASDPRKCGRRGSPAESASVVVTFEQANVESFKQALGRDALFDSVSYCDATL
jgi:hypothetical protein